MKVHIIMFQEPEDIEVASGILSDIFNILDDVGVVYETGELGAVP